MDNDDLRSLIDKVKAHPGRLLASFNKRETMTNWQRHQWAKAGYPPHRKREFASMERPDAR